MKFLSRSKSIFLIMVFFGVFVAAARAADPVVVEVHYQNGVKFYQRGFYDRAIQEFERTLSLEPEHAEAREYLDKARALQAAQTRVDAKRSRSGELESLYAEGKRLYARREYKAAIDVFEKILEMKPVDDFASFYKERCEILISRELAREKKKEAKAKAKEDALQRKQDAKKDKAIRKAERQAIAEKRRADRKETRTLSEKQAAKEEKRAQRMSEIEEKRAAKLAAKDRARQEKKDKLQAREAERAVVKGEEPKIEMVAPSPDVLTNKELFVRGIEEYGRKDYQQAIATFEQLIGTERGGRKLYTNSARRLMDKAKKKMKAAEEALEESGE